MLDKKILVDYYSNTKLSRETLDTPISAPFQQNLDVVNYDYVDCALNSSMFASNFVKERRTKKYVKTGLIMLNSLNFDLASEIAMFKKTNGVINMSYAAALYVGGLYHLHQSNERLEDEHDFMDTIDGSSIYSDRKDKYSINTPLENLAFLTKNKGESKLRYDHNNYRKGYLNWPIHGYGVGNNLYNEWSYFVKNEHINTDTNTSVIQAPNMSGGMRSFASGKSGYKYNYNDKYNDFYASYSILKCGYEFKDLYDKTTVNVDKTDLAHIRCSYIKSMITVRRAAAFIIQEIDNFLTDAITTKNEKALNVLRFYGRFSREVKADIPTLRLKIYNAMVLEVNTEMESKTSDFSVLLYPSAGGLFNDSEIEEVIKQRLTENITFKDKKYNRFNENLLKRSFRFVWCQSNLNNLLVEKNPVKGNINEPSSIYRTLESLPDGLLKNKGLEVNNKFGYFGNREFIQQGEHSTFNPDLVNIKRVQDLINLIGLHNMEAMESEFIKWTSDEHKNEFTDKYHFTTLLQSIMVLEKKDFTEVIGANGHLYSVDEQLALLYSFHDNDETNSQTPHNINVFLTNAQHTKIETTTNTFLKSKIGINNYTTVGMLSSNGKHIYLDKAPYRREVLFADGLKLDSGFVLRKLLFGDQDIGFHSGNRLTSEPISGKPFSHYESSSAAAPLINKYFNFSIEGEPHGPNSVIRDRTVPVMDFCKHLNIPVDVDLLKLAHPFISSYMYNVFYAKKVLSIDEFSKDLITKLSAKEGIQNYLAGFQRSIKTLTDKNGEGYLLKQEVNKDELEVLKAATYYSVRSLFENNVYAPRKDFFTDGLDMKYNEKTFIDGALFYNFSKENADKKSDNVSGNKSDNCDGLDYDKPTHDGSRAKHLYEYVNVLDRGNNNVGFDLLANIMWVRDAFRLTQDQINPSTPDQMDYLIDTSYFSFLSSFATEHNCLLHPLSSYVNLAATEKNGDSLFGVYNTLERVVGNPALIIQYIGDMETTLKTPESKNTKFGKNGVVAPHNSFCFDIDYENNQIKSKTEDVPDDIKNGNVSCFVVDFGAQNQQIFKSIQIDTSQFTNTEESIKSYVNLVTQENKKETVSNNLFKILTQRSYNCTVEAMGNVMIQPLSYFYIKNVPLFTGAYWIINVSHKLSANVISTTFKGVRQPIATIPNSSDIMMRILKKNLLTLQRIGTSVATSDTVNGVVPNVSPSEVVRNEIVPLLQNMNITLGKKIIMIAQANKEGFYGNTAARRNNNPGNLVGTTDKYKKFNMTGKDPKTHSFAMFKTLQDGLNALAFYYDDVFDAKGNTNYALNRNPTLIAYMEIYAPLGDGENDPVKYSLDIVGMFKRYGVTINVNMPLKGILEIDKTDAGSNVLAMVANRTSKESNDLVKVPKTIPADIANYVLPNVKTINGNLDLKLIKRLDPAIVKLSNNNSIPYMYPAAADKLAELITFAKTSGHNFTISSAYRTYEGQQVQKDLAEKAGDAGRAATPGTSNHGWGLAVDIHELHEAAGGKSQPAINKKIRDTNPLYIFLNEHAATYNFYNPNSLKDNNGSDESWHWEYHV